MLEGRKMVQGMKRITYGLVVAMTLCLLASCASQPSAASKIESTWRPLFQGVDYRFIEISDPRPLRIHVAKVDVQDPAISFIVTPQNGDEPLDTNSQTASSFLAEHECQLAINASPFRPVVVVQGAAQDVRGVSVNDGDSYSALDEPNYGALVITSDRRAAILSPPIESLPVNVTHGVGGFRILLRGGQSVEQVNQAIHPRTAIGVDKSGQYLFMVVIDGRQPGTSEGVSLDELATWMQQFGAYDALNLDGGGSSAMIIQGRDGEPQALNTPINLGIPGMQRPNANHLGVYAKSTGE